MRRTVVLVTILLLIGGDPARQAAAAGALNVESAGQPASFEQAMDRLDKVMSNLGQLRGAVDRTQFDLDALSLGVASEAEARIAFVRDEIAFEQYAGSLRGASGTLMSRAGSCLDQALLLDTLLEDAGFESRISRGGLSDAEARRLVRNMASARELEPPIGDLAAMEKILHQLGELAGVGPEEAAEKVSSVFAPTDVESSEMYRAAQRDAELILATLDEAGVELGDSELETELVTEARDYFWVEYRQRPADEWAAAHPCFAAGESPQIAADTSYSETLPAELQHRLRVQVFIEVELDGEISRHPVTDSWERPAAELVGSPLSFFNYPDGIAKPEDLRNPQQVFERTRLFLPLFDGEPAPGAVAFDVQGNRYELEALGARKFEAKALSKSTTGALSSVAEALAAVDRPEEAATAESRLTGQWIDYTLIAPGGASEAYRRAVLEPDVAMPGAAAPWRTAARLATPHLIYVMTGRPSDGLLLDRFLEGMEKQRTVLQSYYRRLHTSRGDSPQLLAELSAAESKPLSDLLLYSVFEAGNPRRPGVLAYRPSPSLAVQRHGFGWCRSAESYCSSVDVISNTRRFLRAREGRLTSAPDLAVRLGTWETRSEQIALHPPADESYSAAGVLGTTSRFAVLTPGESEALAALEADERTRDNLARDLDRGFVVLVPQASSAPERTVQAWWRVDPETGETLGITADGRGQDTVEYILTVLLIGTWSIIPCQLVYLLAFGTDPCASLVTCVGNALGPFSFLKRIPSAINKAVAAIALAVANVGTAIC